MARLSLAWPDPLLSGGRRKGSGNTSISNLAIKPLDDVGILEACAHRIGEYNWEVGKGVYIVLGLRMILIPH